MFIASIGSPTAHFGIDLRGCSLPTLVKQMSSCARPWYTRQVKIDILKSDFTTVIMARCIIALLSFQRLNRPQAHSCCCYAVLLNTSCITVNMFCNDKSCTSNLVAVYVHQSAKVVKRHLEISSTSSPCWAPAKLDKEIDLLCRIAL